MWHRNRNTTEFTNEKQAILNPTCYFCLVKWVYLEHLFTHLISEYGARNPKNFPVHNLVNM